MKTMGLPALFTLLFALLGFAPGVTGQAKPLLLVVNKGENSLAIVDVQSGRTVGRVATGEGPHEVEVSPDGRLAFVTNYGNRAPGNSISIIDIPAQKEARRIDLGPLRRPHGIVFAGGKVYFTAEVNKVAGRFDPESGQVDWLVGTGQNGTHMVIVAGSGSPIFTSNIGSNNVTAIEPAPGGWLTTVVPVGGGPEGLDLSPDGKELWAAHSRDGGVSIIDTATKQVKQTINAGTKRSNRLKFASDGKRVFISDLAGGELVVIDAGARRETKRLRLGRSPAGILIPPGGTEFYVAVTGEDQIAVIDLNSLEVIRRISTGSGPDGMAWTKGQ